MAKRRDPNGDYTTSIIQQQRQRATTLGEALLAIEPALARLEEDTVVLLGLSVRFPARQGFDWLMIVRAEHPDGRVVAFVQGRTLFDVLEAFVTGVEDKSLRWQPDQYAK